MTINREDLKAFIDNELPGEKSEAIRREIDANGVLAQEVDFLKLLGEGVRDCASETPVRGAEECLTRFRSRKPFPVLACILGAGATLFVLAAIFPVFAQAKNSSKRSEMLSRLKVQTMNKAIADGELDTNGVAANQPAAAAKSFALSPMESAGRARANVRQPATPSYTPSIADTNRMVVQNGDLDEVVHDVTNAQNEAMSFTKALGGFVQSSSLSKSQDDLPEASVTVRVPARAFTIAMDHFKSLATDSSHIKALNVTGQDVTAQYADSTARIKVLGAEEDSYVEMLRRARKLGEIMEIKDRLSNVRGQIESLKSQASALKDQSALSTINLTLEQQPRVNVPPQPTSWSSDSWSTAVNGLQAAMQFLATLGIFLFVYSPIWVPLGLFGLWAYRRSR